MLPPKGASRSELRKQVCRRAEHLWLLEAGLGMKRGSYFLHWCKKLYFLVHFQKAFLACPPQKCFLIGKCFAASAAVLCLPRGQQSCLHWEMPQAAVTLGMGEVLWEQEKHLLSSENKYNVSFYSARVKYLFQREHKWEWSEPGSFCKTFHPNQHPLSISLPILN